MEDLNKVLSSVGISKVKLAKYLGVSRQMLYNYLAQESIDRWPQEKLTKLFSLLNIKKAKDLKDITVDSAYINEVEKKINNCLHEDQNKSCELDLRGLTRKEQELFYDTVSILKQKLQNGKNRENIGILKYLTHFLQSMDNNSELKYTLAYFSKSLGLTDPLEFVFNENQQYIYESIMFLGMTLYNNGGASKSRINDTHKKFEKKIEQMKEEILGRTQELNQARIQALKELGYTEINTSNAKEVLDKIAEIESRRT